MDETKILSSLNQIANKIDDEKLKKEIEDISYRLAGRLTRFDPNLSYLLEAYKRDRYNRTPLENKETNFRIPGFSDFSINFSGLSEEYQISVFRSIFNNFEKTEDLPKGFLDFIFRDVRFGHAVLRYVKNSNSLEIFAKMFAVYEDYVNSLLDKIIQSKNHTMIITQKVEYLEDVLKEFFTPALKNKLEAMLEVLRRQKDLELEMFNSRQIFSPGVEKYRIPKLKQQAEEELKQVLSMNNRQILASLKNIANNLDNNGLYQQANSITKVMVKLAQTKSSEVEEFQRRHPSILQELNILKTRKPDDQGFIDLGGIYHSMKTPYWTMPSKINVSQVKDRIRQLNDPQYLRSLAQKRLKFISDKIENQKNISPDDREILLEDLSYLKSFINVSNLNENPESIPQTTRKIQTPFRPTPLSFGEETTEEPKTFDYNKKVYEIVLKNLKDHLPGRSIEELSLMLSDKSNIEGYQIINRNPTLENKIRSEISKFSQNFIDGKAAEKTMQNLFSKKLLQAKYE